MDYDTGDEVVCIADTLIATTHNGRAVIVTEVVFPVEVGRRYVCTSVEGLPTTFVCSRCERSHAVGVTMKGVFCSCGQKHNALLSPCLFRRVPPQVHDAITKMVEDLSKGQTPAFTPEPA